MIVIRLAGEPSHHDELFSEIQAMADIPGCCDIGWLSFCGYLPLEQHWENGKKLIPIAEFMRARGIRVGIEINGLGHGDSRSPRDVGADNFERMVGPDGFKADGAYCPWGKNTQKYFAEWAHAALQCKPDYYYVDDDLRMEFHGRVSYGCFCDDCIARFNSSWNTAFTREEIVRLMNTDPLWRERYVNQNLLGMADFMRAVSRAAHQASPATQVGWECVYLTEYTGADWEPVFRAIQEETGLPPLTRPGCLFYEDHAPRRMLDKVLNTSYQIAVTPDYVLDRRPEIENTSHTVMGKSIQGTCVESALNLAYGCKGLTYSMLSSISEPVSERERMWRAFAARRPYWQSLIDDVDGTAVGGVALAHSRNAWKTVVPGDTEFRWANVPNAQSRVLCQLGLPVSYEAAHCKVTALHPEMAKRLPDEDIRALLTKNVLTDGETVEILKARGFALPVTALPGHTRNEVYTDHPANRELAGSTGVTDSFTAGVRVQEFVLGEGCEPLAYAAQYRKLGKQAPDTGRPVTCALMHLQEGGVWGLVGTSLWTVIVNGNRRRQLTYLADYLANGLPAYLATDDQAMLIPRVDGEGFLTACTVLNLTIGEMQPLELVLRPREGSRLVLARPGHADISLPARWENGTASVTLPPIPAWETFTVRVYR